VIVALFVCIAFSPSMDARAPLNQEQIMTVWLPGVTEDNYITQVTLSAEQYQTFKDKLVNILAVINATISPAGDGGLTITEAEWQQIFNSMDNFIDTIKSVVTNFPNVNTDQIVIDAINAIIDPFAGFIHPAGVISIGTGFTIIPFYGYESFMGLMFRPIFSRYLFGFSRLGGLISHHSILGRYKMVVLGFKGLFINLGDIGFDRILGPQIYIGRASYGKSVKL
jgi:hypothetical protein